MDGTIGEATLSLEIGSGSNDIGELPQAEWDRGLADGELGQNDVVGVVLHVKEDGGFIEQGR